MNIQSNLRAIAADLQHTIEARNKTAVAIEKAILACHKDDLDIDEILTCLCTAQCEIGGMAR